MHNHSKKKTRISEDDEVKILEGLLATVVAVHDDEVVVETEDGRPKWIKVGKLKRSDEDHVWTEAA
jgi:preprotein translocase subunit YajC